MTWEALSRTWNVAKISNLYTCILKFFYMPLNLNKIEELIIMLEKHGATASNYPEALKINIGNGLSCPR